jgi:redox-sensing transcriptional repressor
VDGSWLVNAHDDASPRPPWLGLPVYLRILSEQFDAGVTSMSSDELAEFAGLNAAKVRKDLSYLGSYGTRGVGYDVEFLVYQIRRELGLTHDWPVVIVGAGNLGQALAGYNGFGDRGFPVGGIVDVDPAKVGSVVGGVRVRHLDELAQVVQSRNISIGVIATPGPAAQEAADALVGAGVTSLLNFAPDLDQRAPRHQRPQGRPRRRTADPQLLRAASGNAPPASGCVPCPASHNVVRRPRVASACRFSSSGSTTAVGRCPARARHDRARAPRQGVSRSRPA